jgi:hypothetical protein
MCNFCVAAAYASYYIQTLLQLSSVIPLPLESVFKGSRRRRLESSDKKMQMMHGTLQHVDTKIGNSVPPTEVELKMPEGPPAPRHWD